MSVSARTLTVFCVAMADPVGEGQVSNSDEMITALATFEQAAQEYATAHGGMWRPATRDGLCGNTFVFPCAGDAIACALEMQLSVPAPLRPRIGVHTADVPLLDQVEHIDSFVETAARLRDLAHRGQILLSAATSALVIDILPAHTWLIDLGPDPGRNPHRLARVLQLCHHELYNEFPPLRNDAVLPVHLNAFVGRRAQISDLQQLLEANRLITLHGAGGVGKTRLAIEIAASGRSYHRICFVDLAPVADPGLVLATTAHALGLVDQPGRSTLEIVTSSISDRQMLVILDNCEHVVDACAELVVTLLGRCPNARFLATSREPMNVAGEVTWRVPSLSLAGEAIELFTQRARLVQPAFEVTPGNATSVIEICRRLDGIPLAIELAAARVRSLSAAEIADSLDDRFQLLTGGNRASVERHQTLRASVDWSYALLTEAERVLFHRLSVFVGGFDLAAALEVTVATDHRVERYQVLDQLTLLVDKSLVVAEDGQGGSSLRYRLLETVRQYALQKLDESGEADTVRTRHHAYYSAMAAQLSSPVGSGHAKLLRHVEIEIDNLRAAYKWSQEKGDITAALQLATSLQPIWSQERMAEGLGWLTAILEKQSGEDLAVAGPVWARALAEKVILSAWLSTSAMGDPALVAEAEQALVLAREANDCTALVRALVARGCSGGYSTQAAKPFFAEAIELARMTDDWWTLSQIQFWQAVGACIDGRPIALRAAAQEAQQLADGVGNRFVSRQCRNFFGMAKLWEGRPSEALALARAVTREADAADDVVTKVLGIYTQVLALSCNNPNAAPVVAEAALSVATELGGVYRGMGFASVARAALATGDIVAIEAIDADWNSDEQTDVVTAHSELMAQLVLARGDVDEARRFADQAVAASTGWHLLTALVARARIAFAQGALAQARDDAHGALKLGVEAQIYHGMPDAMELLAALLSKAGNHHEAARLFGAAGALRKRTSQVRFKVWDADYETWIATVREELPGEFNSAWAQGAALSFEDAIAYVQRGRGERKRPRRGWDSLTRAERNVVQLVTEGLPNKEIAARLFISPRTVQTHLTRTYAKLGVKSRVQLVQEAARYR